MATDSRPLSTTRTDLRTHRTHLAAGAAVCHLGGVTVWRSIKAISQLVVIAAGFYFGFEGLVEPVYAFGGMLIAYLGVEGAESLLIKAGERKLDAAISNNVDRGEQLLDETDRDEVTVTTTVEREDDE